jgi:hypothetical protein
VGEEAALKNSPVGKNILIFEKIQPVRGVLEVVAHDQEHIIHISGQRHQIGKKSQ